MVPSISMPLMCKEVQADRLLSLERNLSKDHSKLSIVPQSRQLLINSQLTHQPLKTKKKDPCHSMARDPSQTKMTDGSQTDVASC